MLNLEEIQNTIRELERGDTTFATCQKLASLYIVRNFYAPDNMALETVTEEIEDILPAYQTYCTVKRQFQLQKLPEASVITAMEHVCTELHELVLAIYSNSDMEEERQKLRNFLIDTTTEIVGDK